jgi:hypothetical protein
MEALELNAKCEKREERKAKTKSKKSHASSQKREGKKLKKKKIETRAESTKKKLKRTYRNLNL